MMDTTTKYVGFGRIPKSEATPSEYWVGTKPFIRAFMPIEQLHVLAMTNMPSGDIRDKIDLIEVYELPKEPVHKMKMEDWR